MREALALFWRYNGIIKIFVFSLTKAVFGLSELRERGDNHFTER